MGVRRHICYVLLWDVTWRSAAKTALVAPLLRAGKAAMWRFQPLCRARWPLWVSRQGWCKAGNPLVGLPGEAWPLRGWGRGQLHGAAFFPGKSRLRFKIRGTRMSMSSTSNLTGNTSLYSSKSLIGEQIKFPVSNARR